MTQISKLVARLMVELDQNFLELTKKRNLAKKSKKRSVKRSYRQNLFSTFAKNFGFVNLVLLV
jgi:hypothetical protein